MLQAGGSGSGFLASIAIVALAMGLVITLWYRMKYHGMDEEHAGNLREAIEGWWAADPETVLVREGDDGDAVEERIRGALAAAERPGTDRPTAAMPLRTTLADAWDEIQSHSTSRFSSVPPIVTKTGILAILVAIFGAIAVSTDAVVQAIQGDGGGTGIPVEELPSVAISLTQTFVTGTVDLLGLFPYVDVLFALGLAFGIMFVSWLYAEWALLATLLVGAAIAIWAFDRRLPADADVYPYQHRVGGTIPVIGALVLVWLAGVVPVAVGRLLGYGGYGQLVGALLAVVTLGWLGRFAVRQMLFRIRYAASVARDRPNPWVGLYLVVRYVTKGLFRLAIPFALLYLGVAIVTGRLWRVISAFGDAPVAAQLSLVIALVGGAVIVAYEGHDRWPEVWASLQKAIASQGTRLLVFRHSVTAVGILVGATIGWAFLGVFGALPVGVVVGLAAYGAHAMSMRARRNVDLFGFFSLPTTRAILVRCTVLDVGGQEQFVADIAGDRFVHADADGLAADTAAAAIAGVTPREDRPSTPSEHFGTHLFDFGFVEQAAREEKLRERVRKHVLDEPRSEQLVQDVDGWKDDLREDYPEAYVEDRVEYCLNREILAPLRDGGYVYRPQNDPWLDDGPDESVIPKNAVGF